MFTVLGVSSSHQNVYNKILMKQTFTPYRYTDVRVGVRVNTNNKQNPTSRQFLIHSLKLNIHHFQNAETHILKCPSLLRTLLTTFVTIDMCTSQTLSIPIIFSLTLF